MRAAAPVILRAAEARQFWRGGWGRGYVGKGAAVAPTAAILPNNRNIVKESGQISTDPGPAAWFNHRPVPTPMPREPLSFFQKDESMYGGNSTMLGVGYSFAAFDARRDFVKIIVTFTRTAANLAESFPTFPNISG